MFRFSDIQAGASVKRCSPYAGRRTSGVDAEADFSHLGIVVCKSLVQFSGFSEFGGENPQISLKFGANRANT